VSDLLLRQAEESILTLALNQPALRNPISDGPTIEALVAAIEEADRDIAVGAVILTGHRGREWAGHRSRLRPGVHVRTPR
jgi:enoyl-CoA hydratase/carnithine racemase